MPRKSLFNLSLIGCTPHASSKESAVRQHKISSDEGDCALVRACSHELVEQNLKGFAKERHFNSLEEGEEVYLCKGVPRAPMGNS